MKRYGGIKGKLDKLVGFHFRSRKCDYCGCGWGENGRIEWCHIRSRKYLSLRWNLHNAVSLCSKHHRWFTDNPDLFGHWLALTYPGRREYLDKEFQINQPIKQWMLEELYKKLKEELT